MQMRAAVNYTAGKYACFCLKIHQECSEECVTGIVVVFVERQGIATPPPNHHHLPLHNESPLVCWGDSSSFVPLTDIRRNSRLSAKVMLHFSGEQNKNLAVKVVFFFFSYGSYAVVQLLPVWSNW